MPDPGAGVGCRDGAGAAGDARKHHESEPQEKTQTSSDVVQGAAAWPTVLAEIEGPERVELGELGQLGGALVVGILRHGSRSGGEVADGLCIAIELTGRSVGILACDPPPAKLA